MSETADSQQSQRSAAGTTDQSVAGQGDRSTSNDAVSLPISGATANAVRSLSTREEALSKVMHWLFFGVIFAVMPILAGMLINGSRGKGLGFWDLIGRGELLIVTAGLAAAAAGQILTKRTPRRKLIANVLAFGNIVIACLTSIVFANISSGLQDSDQIDQHAVGIQSLWFFGITFITAGSSALIVELEEL
ncbi:hypothetical protein [Streptomyces sp. NPDC007991]|uniref:hypothetical protein n=1 Tax=Streptomyces sp. NPDC007991 TaxID=3364803 RepID=UPI0036EE461D